jgi:hypothetical protein
MPQHGTIHNSLYNAFSFGLFAAYELESEDCEHMRFASKMVLVALQIVHTVLPARSNPSRYAAKR